MASIRRLGPTDGGDLRRLNRLFAHVFEEDSLLDGGPGAAADRDWLGDVRNVALVADEGARIVGGLVAYRLDKNEGRREFYLYDLAVAADARRQGVATALIEALREVARKAGAWVIYVQADLGDEPAITLYERLSAREQVLHFDIAPRG